MSEFRNNSIDKKVFMLKSIEYGKLFAIVGLIWIVGFLVATLATPDVISSSNVLSSFCKSVKCKLWMRESDFPEIATLYFWIVWISFPFWIVIFWKWMISKIGKDERGIIFKEKIMLRHKFLITLCLPIWGFLSYFLIFIYSGSDSRLIKFGSSEIGLAFGGMAIPAGAAVLICFCIFSIKRIFESRK